jgi:hypothetical protein
MSLAHTHLWIIFRYVFPFLLMSAINMLNTAFPAANLINVPLYVTHLAKDKFKAQNTLLLTTDVAFEKKLYINHFKVPVGYSGVLRRACVLVLF